MERLRINVSFPNGPEGRVKAVIHTYNSDAKAWIPEVEVEDIGDTADWSDVLTEVDAINVAGIVA